MLGRDTRVQPPVLDAYSDMPLFNTKAVVHQTAVPAPTLRAWERRYGILSPRRGDNDYRLYSERDMVMVAWLRERVETGMTISQAIALLRSLEPARRRGRKGRTFASPSADITVIAPATQAPDRFSLSDLCATLLYQFANLDEYSASRTIAQALAIYPIEEVCLSLLTPTLVEVGRLWAVGEASVVVEHFASAIVRGQLESLFRSAAAGESGPLIVVGCAPGEMHELGALMLSLFLRRAGMRVMYLGQNVEPDSLIATLATLKPACVLLSAARQAQAETLAEIGARIVATSGPQPLFCFGGQAFLEAPELAQNISGHFLGTNARDAVDDLKKRLSA